MGSRGKARTRPALGPEPTVGPHAPPRGKPWLSHRAVPTCGPEPKVPRSEEGVAPRCGTAKTARSIQRACATEPHRLKRLPRRMPVCIATRMILQDLLRRQDRLLARPVHPPIHPSTHPPSNPPTHACTRPSPHASLHSRYVHCMYAACARACARLAALLVVEAA